MQELRRELTAMREQQRVLIKQHQQVICKLFNQQQQQEMAALQAELAAKHKTLTQALRQGEQRAKNAKACSSAAAGEAKVKKEKLEDAKERINCAVCQKRAREVLLLPCNHLVQCEQ